MKIRRGNCKICGKKRIINAKDECYWCFMKIIKEEGLIEQYTAEKLRKKINKRKYLEPGTIKYGLIHKQNFNDFFNDALERRKQKREQKK